MAIVYDDIRLEPPARTTSRLGDVDAVIFD